MKPVRVKYLATGHGQGASVEINVKLPDGSWAGGKKFEKENDDGYLVTEAVYRELRKLGGFELVAEKIPAAKPKAKPKGGNK